MHMQSALRTGALITLASIVMPGALGQSAPTRVVALTDTDGPLGPGLGPGLHFSQLGGYGRDGNGRVAFWATITAADDPWDYQFAIMLDDANGRRIIDSTADADYQWIEIRDFDDNGLIIARRPPQDPKTPVQGISLWRWANDGASTLICREGEAVPGAPTGWVLDNVHAQANALGEILVTGDLYNPATYSTSENGGVWRWTPNGLEPVLVMGQHINAGLEGDVVAASMGYFNDDGRLFLRAMVRDSNDVDKRVLLLRDGDALLPIITEGDPVSDGSGGYYSSASVVSNSDGQQLIIYATLEGLGAGNHYSASRYRDGQVSLIARLRDPAPGLGGPWFINFSPSTNRNDEVVMTTSISHQPGDAGWHRVLWRVESDNSMQMLLRNGDTLPHAPEGHTILQFGAPSTRITDSGDIAISAKVGNGAGATLWGDWLRDANGRTGLLVRGGQPLPISSNDVRIAEQANVWLQGDAGIGSVRFEDGCDALIEVEAIIACPGDATADHIADMSDLMMVTEAFNKRYDQPGYAYPADLNRDGHVDFTDLNIVLAHFNQSCR